MIRAMALVLTLLTGFSGLVYEVAWQRYLATLLGSQSEATAAVLAIFLGGLSIGYWLFGRITRQVVERAQRAGLPPRLLVIYGCVEGGIGLYVLVFPWLFKGVQALSYAIPHGPAGVGFAIDVFLSAVLIGPASILMGGTIPILTQGLARSLEDATRFHAFVYAFNTAGAFAGALAAGFYLVPKLGLVNVMHVMGGINIFAGLVFLALGARSRPTGFSEAEPESARPDKGESLRAYWAVSLLTGFAMMVVQTALIRIAGLSFGSSQFTFSMVVAVFVLCIALGSFLVSAFSRIRSLWIVLNQWALALLLLILYGWLQHSPYWAHFLRSLFRDESAAFGSYYFLAFLSILTVIGLPVILSGASLPLLFHQMRREVGHLGDTAGNLYSWNTVGSLLGALFGGYVFFFWLDLHHIYRIAVMALLLAALLLTIRIYRWRSISLLIAIPMLATVTLMPAWNPEELYLGLFRERKPLDATFDGPQAFRQHNPKRFDPPFLFHTDDPIASIAAREHKTPSGGRSVSIVNNGKSDGNTHDDYMTMALAATLPALMAKKAETALVIGWGTGVTAGELASFKTMKRVDVAEISPGVMEAASFFDFASLNASRDAKIHVIESDAYRALMRTPGRFDIIVSEPSNPWVTGVEMLFSREFLLAAKERLAEGGVYAQWFHQYETDDETVALVLRTYADVFDHIAIWSAGSWDLLLLGFDEPSAALDHFRLEERASRPDFAASLLRSEISSFPQLLAHERVPLGVVHAEKLAGPIHTLYHPLLNDRAGRAFFRGDLGNLPFFGSGDSKRIAQENSMNRAYEMRFRDKKPDHERASMVLETFRSLDDIGFTMVAQWESEESDSEALRDIRDNIDRAIKRRRHSKAKVGGEEYPADIIDRLVPLFGTGRDLKEHVSPALAQQATEDFVRFYHHAAPFRGEALIEIWGQCREGGKTIAQCRTWAQQEAGSGTEQHREALLDSCLANRPVGDRCQAGLKAARQLLEANNPE